MLRIRLLCTRSVYVPLLCVWPLLCTEHVGVLPKVASVAPSLPPSNWAANHYKRFQMKKGESLTWDNVRSTRVRFGTRATQMETCLWYALLYCTKHFPLGLQLLVFNS